MCRAVPISVGRDHSKKKKNSVGRCFSSKQWFQAFSWRGILFDVLRTVAFQFNSWIPEGHGSSWSNGVDIPPTRVSSHRNRIPYNNITHKYKNQMSRAKLSWSLSQARLVNQLCQFELSLISSNLSPVVPSRASPLEKWAMGWSYPKYPTDIKNNVERCLEELMGGICILMGTSVRVILINLA